MRTLRYCGLGGRLAASCRDQFHRQRARVDPVQGLAVGGVDRYTGDLANFSGYSLADIQLDAIRDRVGECELLSRSLSPAATLGLPWAGPASYHRCVIYQLLFERNVGRMVIFNQHRP